jgi:aspartate carbamoyltransferase regulatory subunit
MACFTEGRKPFHVKTLVSEEELHFRCLYCQKQWAIIKSEPR